MRETYGQRDLSWVFTLANDLFKLLSNALEVKLGFNTSLCTKMLISCPGTPLNICQKYINKCWSLKLVVVQRSVQSHYLLHFCYEKMRIYILSTLHFSKISNGMFNKYPTSI